jgi:hypothetical protein
MVINIINHRNRVLKAPFINYEDQIRLFKVVQESSMILSLTLRTLDIDNPILHDKLNNLVNAYNEVLDEISN